MVIIQLIIVMARYIFGIGFLKLQELLIYLHGLSFTLAAGYTLLNDEHVRVDLIYRASSDMYKSCLLYTSPSPRDRTRSRMPSSA